MKKRAVNICVLDETGDWSPEVVGLASGRILGIFMYLPDEVTHCCELTPSYELYFLEYVPKKYPDNEERREQLYEWLDEAKTEIISYLHCSIVDKLPEIERGAFEVGRYKYGKFDSEEETLDDVIEHYSGNPDY